MSKLCNDDESLVKGNVHKKFQPVSSFTDRRALYFVLNIIGILHEKIAYLSLISAVKILPKQIQLTVILMFRVAMLLKKKIEKG